MTLASGETLHAPVVLSGAHPRTTMLDLVGAEHLPDEVAEDMRRYRSRGGSVKVNWILSEPPRFERLSEAENAALLHTSLAIAPSIDQLERAWQDATRGVPAEQPYIEVEVPTSIDPSLTDDGTTVMTMFTQYGPHDEAGWPDGAREAYAQRCLAILAEHAPNVTGAVLEHEVLAPPDLERIFGLQGGSIFQGEQGLDQMAFMRPAALLARYATPVDGLYLCGAGTHPGGGVIAASGHNAAQRVLRDLRRRRFVARIKRFAPDRSPATLDRGLTGERGPTEDRKQCIRRSAFRTDPSVAARPRRRAGADRGRRRVARRLREHDHAGRRRAARAAAARGSSATRPRAARSTPSGIPLARRDYPVTLPRVGDHVATGAKPERGGELQIYNYADYLNPAVLKAFGKQEGVSVRVTTFQSLDEAFSKLSTGRLKFDVIFSSPDQLSRLVGRRLVQPLNFELVPNLRANAWPELHDPFYDVGPRYTRARTPSTRPGSAGATTSSRLRPASSTAVGRVLGGDQAARPRRHPRRLARGARDGADAPRRHRPQHRGPGAAQAGVDRPAGAQPERAREGHDHRATRRCRPGACGSTRSWSGDLLNAVISYLPEGTSRRRALVLVPGGRRAGLQRLHLRRRGGREAGARPPVPELPARQRRSPGELRRLRRLPAAASPRSTRRALFERRHRCRRTCATAVVTREDYANGNAYLTLTADGQQLWDRRWATFRNG